MSDAPHLAHRLEQDNSHRCSQVQTARPPHRNREQFVGVGREQTFRQAFGLASEDQKIAGPEMNIVVSALRFCGEEKETRVRFARPPQVVERIPELQFDFLPVIEAGPFQGAIVDGKPERLHQMQRRTGGQAEPANVAGIRRDFRLDEDDVEGNGVMERWSNGVLD